MTLLRSAPPPFRENTLLPVVLLICALSGLCPHSAQAAPHRRHAHIAGMMPGTRHAMPARRRHHHAQWHWRRPSRLRVHPTTHTRHKKVELRMRPPIVGSPPPADGH